MAADNDMFDVQMPHRIVDHAHHVQIRIADQIGNVAVDESFTGAQACDLLGRDAAVAAANP